MYGDYVNNAKEFMKVMQITFFNERGLSSQILRQSKLHKEI